MVETLHKQTSELIIALFNIFSCWPLFCHQVKISSGVAFSKSLGKKYFRWRALRVPGVALFVPLSVVMIRSVAPKEFVSRIFMSKSQKVLYCIILYCIVLYCIVLYCIVLYCIVLYCIVLYCIVLYL